MKIYDTIAEVRSDIIDGCLTVEGSVRFTFSFAIDASIVVKAGNIEARDIEAGNIEAWNIEAWNIKAWNIKAGNIKAGNIEARDIEARDIKAGNISFYAVCFAYLKFTCQSISGRRENARYFCLDSEIVITSQEAK